MIKISDKLIRQVAAKARNSKRKRLNYNFHKSYNEKVQRLLNVAYPGTYIRPHKHENPDKVEVFIILNGKVKIIVDNEEDYLEKGDAVLIPVKAVHQMINKSQEDIDYIALGISTNDSGKTVKA